jgi:hypothetical protein
MLTPLGKERTKVTMNQIEKAVAPLDWSGEDLVMLARLGRFAGCEICPPISYCENSNEDAFLCVAINATWGDPIMGPHTWISRTLPDCRHTFGM